MKEFSKTKVETLMTHENLWYDDIGVGGKCACLNYNLLGICNNANRPYQQTKANPKGEMIKAIKVKLDTAIASYVK